MTVLDWLSIVVLAVLLVAHVARWRLAVRRRRDALPRAVPVVQFRRGLSDEERDQLGRRLRAQREIREAFGEDWRAPPTARPS